MPIDRDLADLAEFDESSISLWHQFAIEVRQEQLKLAPGKVRRLSSPDPIDPDDILDWACSISDDAGDGLD